MRRSFAWLLGVLGGVAAWDGVGGGDDTARSSGAAAALMCVIEDKRPGFANVLWRISGG